MSDVSPTPDYQLPNGLHVHQLSPYETDFVYHEVFEQQIYTRPFEQDLFTNSTPAPCVFDVGANIGLFSLFIKQRLPHARVLAFEPSPVLMKLLQHNLHGHGDITLLECGLGAQAGQQTFTYYPRYSVMSGFHGDAAQDRALLMAGIAQQLKWPADLPAEERDKYFELLVGDKLEDAQQQPCAIDTLSAIIDRYDVPQIDLLKIDAEKSELGILRGIDTGHWPRIKRLAMEAHSPTDCEQIIDLLTQRGYRVSTEQSAGFQGAATFNVYAQH